MIDDLFGGDPRRKHCISRLVHHFITAVEFFEVGEFEGPLIRYRVRLRAEQRSFLASLKDFVVDQVIKSPEVQHLEFKGQFMVLSVFEALHSDPMRLLPKDALAQYRKLGGDLGLSVTSSPE